MKIFILEDDLGRIARFRQWFDGHNITQVDSCASVDAFQPPYDVIFLDHDLGGRQLEDHEDNGEAFAKLIKPKLAEAREGTPIVVHSFSPWGARNIVYALHCRQTPCYEAPFMSPRFFDIVRALTGKHIVR